MSSLKEILVKFKLEKTARWLRNFYLLFINYFQDLFNYFKYSSVFSKDNIYKLESDVIMAYHSIEKGFLHHKIRPKFAREKVILILNNISRLDEFDYSNSQIISAKNVLCKYYEYHLSENVCIDSFFSRQMYEKIKKDSNDEFSPVHVVQKNKFYEHSCSSFTEFSKSRKSLRDFSNEIIDYKKIQEVVKLANTAPSVCNRQSSKVYLVNSKDTIDNVLRIQGGFVGYENNVKQLLILTSNKNFFYTIGERNQVYIDGGIYLMNLLYSLHFYKIAACPANWGKCVSDDKKIRKYLNIPMSEQIICLIPIGYPKDEILYANSERRSIKETLVII